MSYKINNKHEYDYIFTIQNYSIKTNEKRWNFKYLLTHIMKMHNDIYPADTYLSDNNIDSIDVFDNENNHSQTSLAVLKFTQRHPNITFSIQPYRIQSNHKGNVNQFVLPKYKTLSVKINIFCITKYYCADIRINTLSKRFKTIRLASLRIQKKWMPSRITVTTPIF